MTKLKLILKDGTEISGESFGYSPKKGEEVDGEVVFTTAKVVYPETFTGFFRVTLLFGN